MGKQIKTKGIVLHEMPVGDYDKRLILLTKEEGKVIAFAKGARRTNNKMLACTQLFAYGEFVLSKGKTSYNIYQAELVESFHHLRLDIENLTYAMYMLEFTDFIAGEEMENKALMKLLLYALNATDKERMNSRLIVQAFQLKAMSIMGLTPWVNDCCICHRQDPMKFFSSDIGGLICDDRSHIVKDKNRVSSGTVHSIRYILSKPIQEVFSFELEETYLLELEYLSNQFVQYHLNHKFKTLEFLKTL